MIILLQEPLQGICSGAWGGPDGLEQCLLDNA
jgi:hypothetical protein